MSVALLSQAKKSECDTAQADKLGARATVGSKYINKLDEKNWKYRQTPHTHTYYRNGHIGPVLTLLELDKNNV